MRAHVLSMRMSVIYSLINEGAYSNGQYVDILKHLTKCSSHVFTMFINLIQENRGW